MTESEQTPDRTLTVFVRNEEQAAAALAIFSRALSPEKHLRPSTPTVRLIQSGGYDGVEVKVLDPNRPFEELQPNQVYLAL